MDKEVKNILFSTIRKLRTKAFSKRREAERLEKEADKLENKTKENQENE
jgi:hypothetical protein